MKRTLLYVLSLAAAFVLCGAAFFSACSSGPSNTSEEAATEGLTVLKDMAGDSTDYTFFGYESESDVGSGELGNPIEIKALDVAALLAGDTIADSMIIDANEYLFPVTVNSATIESIRVEEENDDWEYVSIESKDELQKALELIAANSLVQDDCYILEVDQIGLMFVGYEESGQIILIPLYTTTSPELASGTKYVFTDIASSIKTAIETAESEQNDLKPSASSGIEISEGPAIEPNAAIKAAGKTSKLLGVTLSAQQQDEWCWAASGRMTMLYAGGDSSTITQCAQANTAFSQSTCCTNGATATCNKPHYPEYNSWGFDSSYTDNTAPTWDALKGLIDGNKPFVFLWMWTQGGGHGMVAVGYYEDTSTSPATQTVNIIDPWPPNVGTKKSVPYAKWAGGADYGYTFGGYYYNITKR